MEYLSESVTPDEDNEDSANTPLDPAAPIVGTIVGLSLIHI